MQGAPKIIDKKFVIEIFKPKLGNGSYGDVYPAYRIEDPQNKLACKILSKQAILNKVANSNCADKQQAIKYIIKSTKNQINICQKTSHPNIVRFVYFSETNNNIYLFMEYCDGGDLAKYIEQRGPLEGPAAVFMIKGIISAVSFLYDHNILHRDIKPQNILISNGEPKLSDFGFAKQQPQKDQMNSGTNIGTVLYMAPQLILQSNPHYSIKCDVWSLGVLMYYVLYGQLPWGNLNNGDIQRFKQILREPIRFPHSNSVSPGLKNLISKCLIFSEQNRISIKKLQAQIEEISSQYEMQIQT